MSDLIETLEAGHIRWHTSDEDGGPDVGIEIGLADGSTLWFGEISNRLKKTIQDDDIPSSDGRWIIHYRLIGKPLVLGKMLPSFEDLDGIEGLAYAMR